MALAYLGALLSMMMLAGGLPLLEPLGWHAPSALFTLLWSVFALLVAAAYLKEIWAAGSVGARRRSGRAAGGRPANGTRARRRALL